MAQRPAPKHEEKPQRFGDLLFFVFPVQSYGQSKNRSLRGEERTSYSLLLNNTEEGQTNVQRVNSTWDA
jgi:hypothetical protein